MKITIDTKEDSRAEIQKVIKMLSSLVNGEEVMSNTGDIFGDSSQSTDSSQSQSSDIFGDDSSSNLPEDSSSSSEVSSGSSDSSGGGMFNMFNSGSGSDDNLEIKPKEVSEDEKKKMMN